MATNKIVKHAKKSRAANLEATLKASVDLKLQRFMFTKQACGTDGTGSTMRSTKPKPKLPLTQNITPSPEAIEPHDFSTKMLLETKVRQDETDVALGLLGLSPSPANGHHPEMDMASDSASRASSTNQGGNGSQQPCRMIDPKCHACRGRHVIHTCGTRALPIDLDEVAKQDRLRRDQEEEEKRKVRAEKRRLADQRRREARKHKQRELEEQRRREDEELRVEKERIRRIEEARATFPLTVYQTPVETPAAVVDVERQRREMIVASYANHLSHASVLQPPVEMNSVDYSRHTYEERHPATAAVAAASAASTGPWERPRMAPYPLAIEASPSPPPPPQEPSQTSSFSSSGFSSGLAGSTSMGTLSSADALVALAGLAGLAGLADMKAEPQEPVPGNGQSLNSAFTRPAMTFPTTTTTAHASHGFGGSSSSIPAALPRRAIPSFAVIRGQANGQDVGSTAPAPMPTGTSSGLAAANGLPAATVAPDSNGTSRPYNWPPEARPDGTSWPPTAS